jgi:hydrogenase expression/formation protein HypC
MKITELKGDEGIVSAGGLKRRANFSLLKDAKIGEYVLVHAGFAIERVKDAEARRTLHALKSIA